MLIEGIRITNDYIFKKIFQDTEILKDLVSSIINEKLTSLQIIDPEILPDTIGDKLSRLDILAETDKKEKINVEMQLSYREGFDDRMAYYAMRLHAGAGSFKEGEQYKDIKRTIVIDILDFEHRLLKDGKEFCTDFRLRNSDGTVTLTNKFIVYYVELPKIPEKTLDNLAKSEKWVLFLRNKGGKDMQLRQVLESEPMIARAITVAEALARDEYEMRMAQRREDAIRDYNDGMSTSHDEGVAEGEARIIKCMAQSHMPIGQISSLVGMSEQEILNILER